MKARRNAMNSNIESKEAFLHQLDAVQEQFRSEGIDYRIVGSLASHALIGANSDIPEVSFNRPGAATPDQRVPDIDMVVPRKNLSAARDIRQQTIDSNFPIKIGLAIPTTEIDFRPYDETSSLTHKSINLPISNKLFQAEMASFHGVDIQTVPTETLLHTFGTFGGKIRHKDLPIIRALMRSNPHAHNPETDVFHEFQQLRRKISPGEYRLGRTIEAIEEKVPRRLRNELYKYALKGADVLGKR